MKKITFLIALSITCISASAQTVLNPGFETWIPNTETSHTYQVPQRWISSAVILTFFNDLFGNPGYVVNNVSQSSPAHNGSYAVQMSVAVSNYGDTSAGYIAYGNSLDDVLNGGGFPLSTRPANLTGWKKWVRIGGDSASVYVVMSKWNAATQSRDTVGVGEIFITSPSTSYTTFSVPINYVMNVMPDTVFIGIGNLSTVPHIGSVLTVDDLAFSGNVPIGINENNAATTAVVVMPNPFNEQATLNLKGAQISNGKMELYDVLGNKVREMENLSGSNFIISREGLPAGIYFYTLSEENTLIATGKLSVE
ncbi:hypothetical protein BH11BAC7_BH11BAC7_00910 [soil metagenome]